MPELKVERSQRPRPLLALPRPQRRDDLGQPIPPRMELWVEVAKGVAGCAICDRPIPKGIARLKLLFRLDEPVVNRNGTQRFHETYYLHPGCVTERVKPEIVRMGLDCYDCGEPPEESETGFHVYGTRHRCFTVSRFSHGLLCERCITRPHWSQCQICTVFYPPWMVSKVVSQGPLPDDGPFLGSEPDLTNVNASCEFCARRFNLVTETEAEKAAEDFAKLRAEIAEHGVWNAGEDD